MSQDTEQLIAQYFAAYNHADWVGMLAVMSDDVVYDLNDSRRVGLQAFTEQLNESKQSFLEVISDIATDLQGNGERAISAYTISGQYLATAPGMPAARGQRYRIGGKSIFDIREGKISRIISEFDEKARRAQLEE